MGMFSDLKKIDQEAQIEAKKKASHSPIIKKSETDKPVISDKPQVEKMNVMVKLPQQTVPTVKEIRVTLPLPTDTLSFLDQMERDIFIRRSIKFRSRQRLTKNSIARAWLALLQDLAININNIEDENDLSNRLKQAIYKNQSDENMKL